MSSLIGSTPLPRRSFVLGSFAAAASAAMVSACGSGGSGSSGAQTLALSTQNPDVESADPATWAILQGFAAAHPEVSIDVSGQAVAEHLQSLSIAAQSDTLPDIFWIYQHTAEQMSSSGILLDLGPIVDELGITDRIASSTIESFTNDAGRLYGVPYQSLLTGLWCNTALFEEHGVAIPTTFDELLDVTRTFAAAGVTTISDGANQSSFSVWSFLTWLSRFGFDERIAGILDGSDTYTNDDFRRCYQHIDELRDAGAFASNVSTQTYQQAVDSFVNGRAAMLDAGVWAAGAIQASDIAGTIDFWKGPEFSDGVGDQNIIMNVPSAPSRSITRSARMRGSSRRSRPSSATTTAMRPSSSWRTTDSPRSRPTPPPSRMSRRRSRRPWRRRPRTGSPARRPSPTFSYRPRWPTACTTRSTASSRGR